MATEQLNEEHAKVHTRQALFNRYGLKNPSFSQMYRLLRHGTREHTENPQRWAYTIRYTVPDYETGVAPGTVMDIRLIVDERRRYPVIVTAQPLVGNKSSALAKSDKQRRKEYFKHARFYEDAESLT